MKKYTYHDLIQSESFRRWASGYATIQEKHYWDRWVLMSDQNRNLARKAQTTLTGISMRSPEKPDREKSWNEFRNKYLQSYPVEKSGKNANSGPHWYGQNKNAIFAIATLALFCILYVYVFELTNNRGNHTGSSQTVNIEYSTTYGEKKEVNLDRTAIILNSNSNLTYTVHESDKTEIEITLDGEAHFSVSNQNDPDIQILTVRTPSGKISVTGTVFVVSANNESTEIVLEKGSVEIVDKSGISATLVPGQLAVLSYESGIVSVDEVNSDVYTSWTTNSFIFDRTPIGDVFSRLERTYGYPVRSSNKDVYDRRISGSVSNNDLNTILSSLSVILGVQIYLENEVIHVRTK